MDRESVLSDLDQSKGNVVASRITDALFEAGDADDLIAELTPGQRAAVLLQWVLGEVHNGGYWQFFGNSAGRHLHLLPAAARTVGADQYADHFDRVIAALGVDRLPEDSDERNALIDAMPEEVADRMEALDDEFYDLDDRMELLDGFVWPYAEAHPDEFFVADR
jgi:hypothetical protein